MYSHKLQSYRALWLLAGVVGVLCALTLAQAGGASEPLGNEDWIVSEVVYEGGIPYTRLDSDRYLFYRREDCNLVIVDTRGNVFPFVGDWIPNATLFFWQSMSGDWGRIWINSRGTFLNGIWDYQFVHVRPDLTTYASPMGQAPRSLVLVPESAIQFPPDVEVKQRYLLPPQELVAISHEDTDLTYKLYNPPGGAPWGVWEHKFLVQTRLHLPKNRVLRHEVTFLPILMNQVQHFFGVDSAPRYAWQMPLGDNQLLSVQFDEAASFVHLYQDGRLTAKQVLRGFPRSSFVWVHPSSQEKTVVFASTDSKTYDNYITFLSVPSLQIFQPDFWIPRFEDYIPGTHYYGETLTIKSKGKFTTIKRAP